MAKSKLKKRKRRHLGGGFAAFLAWFAGTAQKKKAQNQAVYEKRSRNRKRGQRTGSVFAIWASAAIGFIGAGAFITILPHVSLAIAICIGIGGMVAEGSVYWHDTREALSTIFQKGFSFKGINSDIKNSLLARELLKTSSVKQWLQQNSSNETDLVRLKTLLDQYEDTGFIPEPLGRHLPSAEQVIAREYRIKRHLVKVGLLFGIGAGAAMGGITFTHTCIFILKCQGISTTAATVLAVSPLWVLALASTFGIAIAFAYGMVMYRAVARAICNNVFKRIAGLFRFIFKPSNPDPTKNDPATWKTYSTRRAWSTLSTGQRAKHLAKCFLKLLGCVLLISVSLMVTLATGGAWLDSSVAFFKFAFKAGAASSNIVSKIFINGLAMPVMLYFALETGCETGGRFCKILAKTTIKNIKKAWRNLKENPRVLLRAPGYIIAALIVVPLFLFHVIGEGAIAAEGAKTSNDSQQFSGFFQFIANAINTCLGIPAKPFEVAGAANTLSETLTDIPFVFPIGAGGDEEGGNLHDHGGFIFKKAGEYSERVFGSLFCDPAPVIARSEATKQPSNTAWIASSLRSSQ